MEDKVQEELHNLVKKMRSFEHWFSDENRLTNKLLEDIIEKNKRLEQVLYLHGKYMRETIKEAGYIDPSMSDEEREAWCESQDVHPMTNWDGRNRDLM